MTDSPSESRMTHSLHHDHITFEFSEDSTPDSWWINLQLLYPDDTGEHLAEIGMTDVEAMDLVHDLVSMVIRGRVQFNVEAAVQERFEEELEKARHDMPADLFNDLGGHLANSSSRDALFLLERLRARYGGSTRRRLGLDAPKVVTSEEAEAKLAVADRIKNLPSREDPAFWRDEHDESL
jgi:hypothetical protein